MSINMLTTIDSETKSKVETKNNAIAKAEITKNKAIATIARAEAIINKALNIAKAKEEAVVKKAKAKEEAIASKAEKAKAKMAKEIAAKDAAAFEKIFKAKVKADKLGLYYKSTEITMGQGIFAEINSRKSLFKNGAFDAACAFSSYYPFDALYQDLSYLKGTRINLSKIESILGIKGLNHILPELIKENGIMDSIGLTRTTDEIPLLKTTNEKGQLKFITTGDTMLSSPVLNSNYYSIHIKYPVRSFYKAKDSGFNRILDGTYYDKENTFIIPFQVIMYCIKNSEIGLMGFYLYSYLKSKQNEHDFFNLEWSDIEQETGMVKETVIDYMKKLTKHKMASHLLDVTDCLQGTPLEFENFLKTKKRKA